jgi:hypothetical protein
VEYASIAFQHGGQPCCGALKAEQYVALGSNLSIYLTPSCMQVIDFVGLANRIVPVKHVVEYVGFTDKNNAF